MAGVPVELPAGEKGRQTAIKHNNAVSITPAAVFDMSNIAFLIFLDYISFSGYYEHIIP